MLPGGGFGVESLLVDVERLEGGGIVVVAGHQVMAEGGGVPRRYARRVVAEQRHVEGEDLDSFRCDEAHVEAWTVILVVSEDAAVLFDEEAWIDARRGERRRPRAADAVLGAPEAQRIARRASLAMGRRQSQAPHHHCRKNGAYAATHPNPALAHASSPMQPHHGSLAGPRENYSVLLRARYLPCGAVAAGR